MFGKSKKVINLVIEDYVIRILESARDSLSPITILKEKPLPFGLIVNGRIVDEIGFFDFMKELVKELGIKNRQVRFYVPNAMVIMREVEFPSDLKEREIREYFDYEIGENIQLPFKEPVFDVEYDLDDDDESFDSSYKRKGILYAVPREEMIKYTEILADASLKPISADVAPLGIYRYSHFIYNLTSDRVYLFVQLSVTSFDISIFHNHKLEFMRFQDLDLNLKGWKIDNEIEEINWEYEQGKDQQLGTIEDQIIELERIMNFYQFSMKKGEKKVNELIVLGDHPLLTEFYHRVKNQLEIPTRLLNGYISSSKESEVGVQFIPVLGLALKGAITNAS